MVQSQAMPLIDLAKEDLFEPNTSEEHNPYIGNRCFVPGELTPRHVRGWRSIGPAFLGRCYCPLAPIVQHDRQAVTLGTKMIEKGLGWEYHDVEYVSFPRGYKDWGIEILNNHASYLKGQDGEGDYIYGAVYCSLGDYFVSPSLLKSLLEHWDPETNTLLFRFGERTVTLLDMYRMTGLPVDGEFYEEYVPPAHELESSLLLYPNFLKDLLDIWDYLAVGNEVKFQAWCDHFFNRREHLSFCDPRE